MRNSMRALANVLPDARYRTLDGQTHIVKPKVLAPVLAEFFAVTGSTFTTAAGGFTENSYASRP
jgi:hypothetical protein